MKIVFDSRQNIESKEAGFNEFKQQALKGSWLSFNHYKFVSIFLNYQDANPSHLIVVQSNIIEEIWSFFTGSFNNFLKKYFDSCNFQIATLHNEEIKNLTKEDLIFSKITSVTQAAGIGSNPAINPASDSVNNLASDSAIDSVNNPAIDSVNNLASDSAIDSVNNPAIDSANNSLKVAVQASIDISPEEKIKEFLDNYDKAKIEQIKTLLEQNPALIQTSRQDGKTLLHLALENKDEDFINFLFTSPTQLPASVLALAKDQIDDKIASMLVKEKKIHFLPKLQFIYDIVLQNKLSLANKISVLKLVEQEVINNSNWFKEYANLILQALLKSDDKNQVSKDLLEVLVKLSENSVYEYVAYVKTVGMLELLKEVDNELIQQPIVHKIIESSSKITQQTLDLVNYCLTQNQQLGTIINENNQNPLDLAIEKYRKKSWKEKDEEKEIFEKLIKSLLKSHNPEANDEEINQLFADDYQASSQKTSTKKRL
jgi:hypothetical protein